MLFSFAIFCKVSLSIAGTFLVVFNVQDMDKPKVHKSLSTSFPSHIMYSVLFVEPWGPLTTMLFAQHFELLFHLLFAGRRRCTDIPCHRPMLRNQKRSFGVILLQPCKLMLPVELFSSEKSSLILQQNGNAGKPETSSVSRLHCQVKAFKVFHQESRRKVRLVYTRCCGHCVDVTAGRHHHMNGSAATGGW